jgi:peptidoglycan/LPS O-acetylase OafA/YrhL
MSFLNPIFALLIFFTAYTSAYLLNYKNRITVNKNRYESIDGLRGFLAIAVFIHHSSIWFQYLQINSWEIPKSKFYNQLGQISVSFFFMITVFLFISKLLNTKSEKINWNSIFISRFFRIVPLYIFSITLLILIIFLMNNWELNVSISRFFKELFFWITFTLFRNITINNSDYTYIINAGVVWSLTYEWLFYFSLPLISVFIYKKITSKIYLIISLIFILLFFKFNIYNQHHLLSLLGGAIAPFLIKYTTKKINFNTPLISALILLLVTLVFYFDDSNNYICKLLLIIIFNLIALGNNVFGILKSSTLKFLGEISYSIYLIHGIIIFSVMYFFFSLEEAKKLTPLNFYFTILVITPILVFICFSTYNYIEKPFINLSKKLISKNKQH